MNNIFSPDLIFFVLVAAFLIIRLRSVLGKRTGNEKRPKDFFIYQDTSITSNKKKSLTKNQSEKIIINDKLKLNKEIDSKKYSDLQKIRFFDDSFSPKRFIEGAKIAFQKIIDSYAKGEINKVKNLIGNNVFSIFSREIKSRSSKKQVLEHTLVSIKSANIQEIDVKSNMADIVVKFVSEQVNLLKNEKGKILKGNDEYIENHTNYWTFSKDLKSNNPNWKLVVTKSG